MLPAWFVTNAFTLMIIYLILVVNSTHSNKTIKNRIFIEMVGMLAFLIILDSFGHIEPRSETLLTIRKAATFFVFLFDPLYHVCGIFYIDSLMDNIQREKRNRNFVFILPILTTFLCLLTIISQIFGLGWFFYYIDDIYCRGPLFEIRLFYLVTSAIAIGIYTFHNKNFIGKQYQSSVVLFPFIPVVFGITQVFIYGVSTEYVGMALAILILFISVQNKDMNRDALTGLYNRRKFDIEFEDRIREAKLNKIDKSFALIMIDLDYFKNINDTYGHKVGDDALENMANILIKSFKHNTDIITRFGGDEFAVITSISSKQELDERLSLLKKRIRKFNKLGRVPYQLYASIGGAIYRPYDDQTPEEFIATVDKLMYLEKEKNHSKEKRGTNPPN